MVRITKTQYTLLNFEDLTVDSEFIEVPSSYGGLSWTEFHVIEKTTWPISGYNSPVFSGNNVGFVFYGTTGIITSTSSFSVGGFYANAAWRNGLNVRVESFEDASGTISKAVRLITLSIDDGPEFIDLFGEDFQNIRRLEISASGGTPIAGLAFDSTIVAIDDLYVQLD